MKKISFNKFNYYINLCIATTRKTMIIDSQDTNLLMPFPNLTELQIQKKQEDRCQQALINHE